MPTYRCATADNDHIPARRFTIDIFPSIATPNHKGASFPSAVARRTGRLVSFLKCDARPQISYPDLQTAIACRPGKSQNAFRLDLSKANHLRKRSCPVFRTTSRICFSRAKLIPAATSAISVALTVYLGWSPMEHDPTGATDVEFPFGHVSVG